MKYKLVKYRLTIPQEVREHSNIPKDGYVDISYDEKTGNIVIREYNDNVKDEPKKISTDKPNKPNKPDKPNKPNRTKEDKSNISRRKIEANFMDADKLYKAYYSECGLVAKTKTRYVNDFCNECQGRLAKEWEDRVEVKCSRMIDNVKENTINKIKENRKKELDNISNSIKEANKVLDVKINEIKKSKRGRKPKQKIVTDLDNTTIQPVNIQENKYAKCVKCRQFFKSGFLLNDKFVCKECTKSDFKEYMKKRSK